MEVIIKASQVVHYKTVLELTDKEYEDFCETVSTSPHLINAYINTTDVIEADDTTDVAVEIAGEDVTYQLLTVGDLKC